MLSDCRWVGRLLKHENKMKSLFTLRVVLFSLTCFLFTSTYEISGQSPAHYEGTKRDSSSNADLNHIVIGEKRQKRFLGKLKKKLKKFHAKWKMSKKEIKKLFKEYYECIKRKINALEKEEFPIKAILALEGEKVCMECNVCYRPDQPQEDQGAHWQFLRHEDTGLIPVSEDKKYKIKKDNTLVVKDVDLKNAGQYFCLDQRDYAAVYQLDVFLMDKRRYVILGKDQPLNNTLLKENNLQVFTMWAEWGACNACGKKGQKKKIGQCTVKKINEDKPVAPRDFPLMALYPEGVPCHSTALPRVLRHIPQIGMRHSETLVDTCTEVCTTDPPQIMGKQITDKNGKVIDVLEPGFYPVGSKPALPPPVKRKVLYEQEASHLVLNCPIDEEAELIRWMRGKREVDPTTVNRQTQGRVFVDKLNRLHLNPVLLSDTAVYNNCRAVNEIMIIYVNMAPEGQSCWVKTRRVASIKLLVIELENQKIKLYISYIGLGLTILGSFLFMCCLCCKKSDKAAQ